MALEANDDAIFSPDDHIFGITRRLESGAYYLSVAHWDPHATGSYGVRLWQLARGIDERPVRTDRTRKSLSVEHTWAQDIATAEECASAMDRLVAELQERYARVAAQYRVTGLDIKIRYADFRDASRQRAHADIDGRVLHELLRTAFATRPPPVRLLGAGVKLAPRGSHGAHGKGNDDAQPDLFA